MFTKFSSEYAAALSIIVVSVLGLFKVTADKVEVEIIIAAGFTLVNGIYLIVKRYQKGDISKLGKRI